MHFPNTVRLETHRRTLTNPEEHLPIAKSHVDHPALILVNKLVQNSNERNGPNVAQLTFRKLMLKCTCHAS